MTKDASLDELRYALDQRKLALEESWPRKWGSVILGAAATVSAACVSAGVSIGQNWLQQRKAIEDRNLATQQADRVAERENDRIALNMYFQYAGDTKLPSDELQRRLELIQALTRNADVRRAIGLGRASNTAGQAPANVLVDTPNLIDVAAGHVYGPQDFRAYVQYYAPRKAESDAVVAALGNLTIRVPGAESIVADRSPRANQIRVYRADHRPFAGQLAAQLKRATGFDFTIVGPIGGGKLPNGVIEIWLGKGS